MYLLSYNTSRKKIAFSNPPHGSVDCLHPSPPVNRWNGVPALNSGSPFLFYEPQTLKSILKLSKNRPSVVGKKIYMGMAAILWPYSHPDDAPLHVTYCKISSFLITPRAQSDGRAYTDNAGIKEGCEGFITKMELQANFQKM